jgi:hypothetical protein
LEIASGQRSNPVSEQQSKNANDNIKKQVDKAFEAARKGNFGPSSVLQKQGSVIVPYLAPYLNDSSEDVRGQVVALLKVLGGEDALSLLVKALADASADVRERAARALYENYDPLKISKHTDSGTALRQSVKAGNNSAAALLLLGYFPGKETESLLRGVRDRKERSQTKLFEWSPVVMVSLPANISLSRLGDKKSRMALLETIEASSLGELEFLLKTIREIDAPEVLHLLKRTLDDEREVNAGVPSGAEPKRRLCDEAVNAFVNRLQLNVGVQLSDARRYSKAEIDTVRNGINSSIPK